ncbi:MAG: EVE domain-containing protein [Armatimonadetes bacterium]|nr:EVE domain-containing protein [Armatimonadota bacterium]
MIDPERLKRLLMPGASLRDDDDKETKQESARRSRSADQSSGTDDRQESMIFVAVANRENYLICKERKIYAAKNPSLLARVKAGDTIVFYISKYGQFAGVYRVTKPVYQAHAHLFDSALYRYFIEIIPVIELPENKWLNLAEVAKNLRMVKDKHIPPGKYFQATIRSLDEADYEYLSSAMSKAMKMSSKFSAAGSRLQEGNDDT